jgi:hypothetical protein
VVFLCEKKENFNNGDHPTADEICEHLAILRGSWKYLDHSGSGGNNYVKIANSGNTSVSTSLQRSSTTLRPILVNPKTYSTKNPN